LTQLGGYKCGLVHGLLTESLLVQRPCKENDISRDKHKGAPGFSFEAHMSRILEKNVVSRCQTTSKLLVGKNFGGQDIQEHMRLNHPYTGDNAQIL